MPGRPSSFVLHPKGQKKEQSALPSGNHTGNAADDIMTADYPHDAVSTGHQQASPLPDDVPNTPVGMADTAPTADTPQDDLSKEIDSLVDDLGMNVDFNSMRNDLDKLNNTILNLCETIHSGVVQQEQPLTASALFDDGPANRQYTGSLEGWKPGQLQSLSGLPLNNIHTSPSSSVTVHPPSTVASSTAPSVTREESKFDYLRGVGQQF